MRTLSLISALIVFELALVVVNPAIDENQDLKYKSNRDYSIVVELEENNISNDQIIPEFEANMSPEYIAITGQLSNPCSNPFEKAKESFKNQKYDSAISYLNETIRICPDLAEAWYDRGYSKFQLKLYNEALDDFSMAIELDPMNADYWTFKGITFIKLNNFNDALSTINISLSINPHLSSAKNWKAHILETIGA